MLFIVVILIVICIVGLIFSCGERRDHTMFERVGRLGCFFTQLVGDNVPLNVPLKGRTPF